MANRENSRGRLLCLLDILKRETDAEHGLSLQELTARLAEEHTPVYLTVDLDCLDPALFCGTGTPEAGGVSFTELLDAILTVGKCNIVGADVNELAPMLDASGASTAAACKIVREMLLAIYR